MSGQLPAKKAMPKYKKAWRIKSGINKHTPCHLLDKKRKAIEIITL